MVSKSIITNITAIPPSISRETAVAQLQDHASMIELNPLVVRHEPTTPPPNATKDEADLGTWYQITDIINYLPGGLWKSEVSYKACFYNTPTGIQTHVFAPAGVDLRGKWSVGGNSPGEPKEPSELGVGKPSTGLYIKEEVELRCNMFMAGFVKRNLKSSHHDVHTKIIRKAKEFEQRQVSSPTSPTEFESPRAQGRPYPGPGSSCSCTGGAHEESCSFYPGLRMPQLPSALSLPSMINGYGQRSPPPIANNPWDSGLIPVIVSPVETSDAAPASPPAFRSAAALAAAAPQQHLEPVELPGSLSPADGNWSERAYIGSPLSFSRRSERFSDSPSR